MGVMGNHDHGNMDPRSGCPNVSPRFVCDASNANTAACGGPRPYSTHRQGYDSNALNADKGGVDGALRANWHAPDYTFFYTIPSLQFELVAMDWNAYDFGGLGGDGPYKSASRLREHCGSEGALRDSLNAIRDASTELMANRSALASAKNVAIIGHYPDWFQGGTNFRRMYLEGMPEQKRSNTKVFNFFGHTHNQICHGWDHGECVDFLTGGAGGCCGNGDLPGGFVAISWDSSLTQVVECFAGDPRCSVGRFAPRGGAPGEAPGSDVCEHTIDDSSCPGYRGPPGSEAQFM